MEVEKVVRPRQSWIANFMTTAVAGKDGHDPLTRSLTEARESISSSDSNSNIEHSYVNHEPSFAIRLTNYELL